ncbi:MAG TPA: tRNA (adenosine(37)-N6)-dimethylallyltransferase MiaA [Woeseiaceae bacterium]|nr:tRNA (adenosine(37)-N6)-dimethylallyltransferase MiaA [Woeseiaceae bacterium]
MQPTAICLMGPTASRKTDIAIELCKRFPCEIISVDSALVYRGMDIGTAKPDAAVLARTPHRLIDIRDPEEAYSAGEFVRDARAAIDKITAAGRVPLLVGGTMLYFRALTAGIADLPVADPAIRADIEAAARAFGWPAMHAKLAQIDPEAATRINPADRQRIQRALEVYRQSGRSLSAIQAAAREDASAGTVRFVKAALNPVSRAVLHQRIAERLNLMLNKGFIDEMKVLYMRPGLSADAPSMRAVGYRQFWACVAGECSADEAAYRTLVATRQLAKRQITWLRSEAGLVSFDPLEADVIDSISAYLIPFLNA